MKKAQNFIDTTSSDRIRCETFGQTVETCESPSPPPPVWSFQALMGGGHAWPSLLIGRPPLLPPPTVAVGAPLAAAASPPPSPRCCRTKDSSSKQTSAPGRRVTRSRCSRSPCKETKKNCGGGRSCWVEAGGEGRWGGPTVEVA